MTKLDVVVIYFRRNIW